VKNMRDLEGYEKVSRETDACFFDIQPAAKWMIKVKARNSQATALCCLIDNIDCKQNSSCVFNSTVLNIVPPHGWRHFCEQRRNKYCF
jgi:hypothetical protein